MAEQVPFSWGSIRLWCSEAETEFSRIITVHDLTSGNEHPTYDAGMGPPIVRLSLIFDDFPGETDPASVRLQRLISAHASGAVAIFTHPIHGSYPAKIGRFSHRFDESSVLTADAEFIPDEEVQAVSPSGFGAPGVSGEASVNAAADDFDANLRAIFDDVQLDSFEESPLSISESARASVAEWNEGEEIPTRQIIADTADISSRLSTTIEDLGLEDDLALFDLFRATIMFGDSVRSAAIASTSETPAVFVMRVTTPVVLIRLMARVYGGAEAEDRERQVRSLNDIRTPGWFGPGDLLMPVKGSSTAAI